MEDYSRIDMKIDQIYDEVKYCCSPHRYDALVKLLEELTEIIKDERDQNNLS